MSAPTVKPDINLAQENERLRAQLAEAQEVIRAIQSGEVDAVVVSRPEGDQVFTLAGAEHAYRILVEAMNEGAAMLSSEGVILYCNQRLSDLVGDPLHQLVGASVTTLVASESQETFDGLFSGTRAGNPGSCEMLLRGKSGKQVPAYVSLRAMNEDTGGISMVATDLTQQKKEQALIAAGELAKSILESAAEGIAVCDEGGYVIAANREMKRLCNSVPLFQHFDKVLPLYIANGSAEQPKTPFSISSVLARGGVLAQEVILDVENGNNICLLLNATPLAGASGYAGCVVTLADITESKRAEQRLQRLNRTLKAMSDSNQSLLHATTEEALLQSVCKIITEDCGYAMVWIGFAEDDPDKTVCPVAHAGFEKGYLDSMRITWADNERGQGPTGTAIRTGKPCECRNMLTDPKFTPWRDEAIKRGYASSLCLPLMEGSQAFGVITIYSTRPESFAAEEILLLQELAADLAYGTSALRVRAAREQAEQALHHHREWLRVTLSSIGDAVLATDTTGQVTFMNPVAASLTGWKPEEAQGQPIQNVFRIINEQTRATAEDIVGLVLRRGAVVELANHTALVTRDGREVPVEDSAAPILDSAGQVVGVVLVFHDVTEKRRAEEGLRESETKFRSVFEHSLDAMFLTKPDGTIIAANPAARAMFGMTEEEICRVGRDGLADPDDSSHMAAALEERARARKANAELRFVRKDGTRLTAEVTSVILGGEPARSFVVMRDVSERKRTQELLIRSEKIAALGRMAASLAHDINNPLAAVVNNVFLAQSSPECADSVRRYLDVADEELKRISHITRQALGFYRETATPVPIALSSMLDEAIDVLKSRIKAKHAKIEKQYGETLKVTAISGELRQVLANLLANSLDAIDDGGIITLRVSTASALNKGNPCARITIADNGHGIGKDLRQHIFEPLFTTKGSIGTGLGLWVSKQIVDKHGGTIRVRSGTDGAHRGTVFCILLPIEPAAACCPEP